MALSTSTSLCNRPSLELFHLAELKVHVLNGDPQLPPPAASGGRHPTICPLARGSDTPQEQNPAVCVLRDWLNSPSATSSRSMRVASGRPAFSQLSKSPFCLSIAHPDMRATSAVCDREQGDRSWSTRSRLFWGLLFTSNASVSTVRHLLNNNDNKQFFQSQGFSKVHPRRGAACPHGA